MKQTLASALGLWSPPLEFGGTGGKLQLLLMEFGLMLSKLQLHLLDFGVTQTLATDLRIWPHKINLE